MVTVKEKRSAQTYPGFYNGVVYVGRARTSGGTEVPNGVQGQSSPVAEAKHEISVQFIKRFSAENLGFSKYRSRASTVYFANTQLKKHPEDSMWLSGYDVVL